ncbi:DUF4232 domain-containing protein [Streptomyces sp. HC307]|uniref:DUF4232 domain-containing protein n=1 Tax=Streptomyces flavusporus TaxID=3385496 RepID=UPI00391738FD
MSHRARATATPHWSSPTPAPSPVRSTATPASPFATPPATASANPPSPRGQTPPAVILKPGGSAYAVLHTVAEGVTDKPCWAPAAQVQAYPPGSTWALRAPANSFRVCGDVFEVHAVKPGKPP